MSCCKGFLLPPTVLTLSLALVQPLNARCWLGRCDASFLGPLSNAATSWNNCGVEEMIKVQKKLKKKNHHRFRDQRKKRKVDRFVLIMINDLLYKKLTE